MKIKNLLSTALLISLLFSCTKDRDQDNGSEPLKNSHRIKQIVYEYEGDFEKTVFLYEGDKLVKVTEYEKDESVNWLEQYKTEITYSGDKVIETWYDIESGSWVKHHKNEYHIQNGLMIEVWVYHLKNEAWVEISRWTHQYSGNRISAWQYNADLDEDGTLEQRSKGEYIYQNGKLTEYIFYQLDQYDNWYQDTKETFSYSGDNLIFYIGYELNESESWEKEYKSEYSYSGNHVSQVEYYWWNSTSGQWVSEGSSYYTYNSNGYLIEELDDYGDKTTFEYEEGSGNIKFFYFPEYLVYGLPTLKSASTVKSRSHSPYYRRLKNR